MPELENAESVWSEYYKQFSYFSADRVRPGCHPRCLVHAPATGKAIVLVHGLTDSPYFMMALADHFYSKLGYSVYVPLLHCHGLKDPGGMEGVSLDEWKNNVRYAVEVASAADDLVAIGGLSTGGTLALYFSCTDPRINGDLYLFSAALGIYDGRWPFWGRFKELILRLGVPQLFEEKRPLIGSNPYRYTHVPYNSAAELAALIGELGPLLKKCRAGGLAKRMFVAWTEADRVVRISALRLLRSRVAGGDFYPFIYTFDEGVAHACVVLKDSIYAAGSSPAEPPLERANPRFMEMLAAIDQFVGS